MKQHPELTKFENKLLDTIETITILELSGGGCTRYELYQIFLELRKDLRDMIDVQ